MKEFISTKQKLNSDKIVSTDSLDNCIKWLFTKKNKAIVLDTETTGLDPYINKPILLQLGDKDTQFAIDLRSNFDLEIIKNILEEDIFTIIGTNIGFDYKMLRRHHNIILNKVYDVSRVDEVIYNGVFSELDPNPIKHKQLYAKAFSLKGLMKRHFDIDIDKTTRNSFINKPDHSPFTEKEIFYSLEDCINPYKIFEKQAGLLDKYKLHSCTDLENKVVLCIADMEYNGISFNPEPWKENAKVLEAELDEVIEKLDTIVLEVYKLLRYGIRYYQMDMFDDTKSKRRTVINWNSESQVLEVLKNTGLNIDSTDKGTLSNYKGRQIVSLLLKYRELSKAISTYGLTFLKWIHPITGRIHPNFWQCFTDTGRLSCDNPNLQNIKRGTVYRRCFIAGVNKVLIGGDYSGQELRIIAHGSQDPLWLDAFKNNEDLHGTLCAKTFAIDKNIIKTQLPGAPDGTTYRDAQKTIDFGLAFGMTAHKLSKTLGCSLERAASIIRDFFRIVPKVEKYLTSLGDFAKQYGYTRTFTPISRIRWFKQHTFLKNMYGKERDMVLGEIERMGKNTPIQGTGADIVKTAMVMIRDYIRKNNLWDVVKLVLQVHDELVIEVDEFTSKKHAEAIEKLMVDAGAVFVDSIPMAVSINIGKEWSK